MAMWPFRRRSRKRSRSGAAMSDTEGISPRLPQPDGGVTGSLAKRRRTEIPRNNTQNNRLERTYSFTPGRHDSIRVDHGRGNRPASRRARRATNDQVPEAWPRTPTLHTDSRPRNRKSTRKRQKDHGREAEIKAMSSFTPVRPSAEPGTAGRPMKRESRKAKGPAATTSGFADRLSSDISLPLPESIHSSLSTESEFASYRVSALDALAPRPTLRCATNPRWTATQANRSGSQRKRLAEREPIPKETIRAHRRVDSLADDLDASDLRELMERDARRREKRKQKERDRMERRIAQKAEQQKAEAIEARKAGTPPPENLERGVMGRELAGLGAEPASAVLTSTKPRRSVESETMPDADDEDESSKKAPQGFPRTETPSQEDVRLPAEKDLEQPAVPQPQPQAESQANQETHGSEEMDVDARTQEHDPSRPSEDHSSLHHNHRLSSLLRAVRTRSKSTLASQRSWMVSPPPDTINEDQELQRKGSGGSFSTTSRARFRLTSFLRWGSRRRRSPRNSGEPSSFANTSRDEVQAAAAAAAQAHAHAQALSKLQGEDVSESSGGNYLARKASIPKRTRSRFREDLPEFPPSPPLSRMQSPEVDVPLPVLPEDKPTESETVPVSGPRNDTPTSGEHAFEAAQLSRTPAERAYPSPSPDPHMSVSMASIDSEGSWLSGRANARRAAMRDSIRRANLRDQVNETPSNSTEEDLAITEDEYLSKLTPRRNSNPNLNRSDKGRPSSDEEDLVDDDDDMKWGNVRSYPRVQHRNTLKSQEGIFEMDSENEDSEVSPISPTSQDDVDFQRAKSVNLGKGHVRNFSAGSAKLLEISSQSSKRASMG